MAEIKEKYRELLDLKQVSERTKIPADSLRWLRHQGRASFLFRLGRRLVAYEDEVDAWIAKQRELTSK